MADTTPSPVRPAAPNLAAAPKTNPATGRREAPAPTPAPVDQAAVTAAVTAALASLGQQRSAVAATPDLDKTIPGGIYRVGDQLVDCEGNPREHPDEASKDEDGKEKG